MTGSARVDSKTYSRVCCLLIALFWLTAPFDFVAQSQTGQHVVVAFESSSTMFNQKNKPKLNRLEEYLTMLLYSGFSGEMNPSDTLVIKKPFEDNPDLRKPLYQNGSQLTFFTFADEPRYIYVGKHAFVPKQAFVNMLPRKAQGSSAIQTCGITEAMQNYDPRTESTRIIVVTRIAPSSNEDQVQSRDCKDRSSAYQKSSSMEHNVSITVGDEYLIQIFSGKFEELPYPFVLKQKDAPVFALEFNRTSYNTSKLADGYSLIINPLLKVDYKVRKVILTIRGRDKEKVEGELILGSLENLPNFGGLEISNLFLNGNYVGDLEIEFELPNKGAKSEIDYFSIRNIELKLTDNKPSSLTESDTAETRSAAPVLPANPFKINSSEVTLESDQGEWKSTSLHLEKNNGNLENLIFSRLKLIDNTGEINLELPQPTEIKYPLQIVFGIPRSLLEPNSTRPANLEISYTLRNNPDAKGVQSLPITLKTGREAEIPVQFSLTCDPDHNVGQITFEISGENLISQPCSIGASENRENFKIVEANFIADPVSIPINMEQEGEKAPFSLTVTKAQWEQLLTLKIAKGSIELLYEPKNASGPTITSIPVNFTIPSIKAKCEVPADPFVISSSADKVNTVSQLPGKRTDNVMQFDSVYLLMKPEIGSEKAACIQDIHAKISGFISHDQTINTLPHRFQLKAPEEQVAASKNTETQIFIDLDYKLKDSDSDYHQRIIVPLLLAKTPTPKFVLAKKEDPKQSAREFRAQRSGDQIIISNIAIGAQSGETLKIEKVQLMSNKKVLHEWQRKDITKSGSLPDAVVQNASIDTESREIPIFLNIMFSRLENGTIESATTDKAILIIPCDWPWPFSELEGILPCIEFPLLLALVVGLPILLLILAGALIIMRRRRSPAYFALVLIGRDRRSDPDDEIISQVFAIQPGNRLALGKGAWEQFWDVDCPTGFIQIILTSFFGQKSLFLGSEADVRLTKMEHGREYPVQCADGSELRIKPLIYSKKPRTA